MPEIKIVEPDLETKLTEYKAKLRGIITNFGIFNSIERQEWLDWVDVNKTLEELEELEDLLNKILKDRLDFEAISLRFISENSIKDVNLSDFLKFKVEKSGKSDLVVEDYAKNGILVLIGEQYFQNWPGITFPNEGETGVHKKVFVLPYADCSLGVVVDLDEIDVPTQLA